MTIPLLRALRPFVTREQADEESCQAQPDDPEAHGLKARLVAKLKHRGCNPLGPNTLTQEAVVADQSVIVGPIELGATFSKLQQIRRQLGFELIQTQNPDGGSNIELTHALCWLPRGYRLELQTLGANAGGDRVMGIRVCGFGFTKDWYDSTNDRALSCTFEAKVTDRSLISFAGKMLPALAEGGKALGGGAAGSVAGVLAGLVPIVSAGIALRSTRRAVQTLRDPDARLSKKILMSAHAVADASRVFFPIPGTLATVGLMAIDLVVHHRQFKKLLRAHAEEPPADPDPERTRS